MQEIGGAYFPGWMLSEISGLVGVAIARAVLIRFGLDAVLEPRLLAYPALTVFFTLLTYLVFFS